MRISILSFYQGTVARGVETLVDALATHFATKHEIQVLQAGSCDDTKSYSQVRIPIAIPTQKTNPASILRKTFLDAHAQAIASFTYQALPLLRSFKPEIIIPANGGWQTILLSRALRLPRAKVVISGQAGPGWDERWNLLQRPDLYIAPSKTMMDWAQAKFPKQRLVLIPNGVDRRLFHPTNSINKSKAYTQFGISFRNQELPLILCVAAHERYKRVSSTIQAVANCEKANLLIVGGSAESQAHGKQVLPGRFAQITTTHTQMPHLYACANLFTLVSDHHEAFGIAYLEALASNLPVVATDDALRRSIIGKAGLYVTDPTDTQAYAQVLQEALSTDWKDLPRQQSTQFAWDRVSNRYELACQELL